MADEERDEQPRRPSPERVADAIHKYLDRLRGGGEAYEARLRRRRPRKRTAEEEARRKEAIKRGDRWF